MSGAGGFTAALGNGLALNRINREKKHDEVNIQLESENDFSFIKSSIYFICGIIFGYILFFIIIKNLLF